jgi:hypothetical protein
MTVEDFTTLMHQMKTSIVPSRLVFIWAGPTAALFKILEGIEVHRQDLANTEGAEGDEIKEPQRFLENRLKGVCKQFQEIRNEPAALVLKNAILLLRYGCDLSAVHRYGISPRSAVIFLIPQESHRHLPPRTDGWVKRNTKEPIVRMAKQLGTPNCIIDF